MLVNAIEEGALIRSARHGDTYSRSFFVYMRKLLLVTTVIDPVLIF